jgi:hypothetical protein
MDPVIRTARVDELEYLNSRIEGEKVELRGNPVWVAEQDGKIIGLIAARLVWQIEPMTVFPEVKNKMTRRRVTRELYRACSAWLGNRDLNGTGVHLAFGVTRNRAVLQWAKAMGWLRTYKGAAIFIKRF